MTDKELQQLAAFAALYDVSWSNERQAFVWGADSLLAGFTWAPLDSGDDADNLAKACGMTSHLVDGNLIVRVRTSSFCAEAALLPECSFERRHQEPKDTKVWFRRTVVRLAAEMGSGMKRYLVCPGYVYSDFGRQRHHVSARELIALYKVPPSDCVVLSDGDGPERDDLIDRANAGELLFLRPCPDDAYCVSPLIYSGYWTRG